MATTYLRLFDPTQQFQLKSGAINTAGLLRVYLNGTDDLADIYDENGTQLAQPAVLDNNGRALGLFVDSKKTYRLEVYDQFGSLLFTVRNMTPCGGGGGSSLGSQYDLVSTDGSVSIDKSVDGGRTTFDLSADKGSPEVIVTASAERTTDGAFRFSAPTSHSGTKLTVDDGTVISDRQFIHFEATVRLVWSSQQNAEADIQFRCMDTVETVRFDLSFPHTEFLDVSADYEVTTDGTAIPVTVSGLPTGLSATVENFSVHAIARRYGEGGEYRAGNGIIIQTGEISIDPTVVQEKLEAGANISIVGNVISATAEPQQPADWAATEGVTRILNKPDLGVYATHSEVTYGLAQKQDTISDLSTIRSGAAAGATAVQPATMNAALAGKQDVISDLSTIRSGAAKGATSVQPADLAPYAVASDVETALAGKQDVISDLSTIRSGASAGATAVQPATMNSALAGKQDTISDLATIRSGAASGATAVQPATMNSALAGKQDVISDLSDIRSGAASGATAVQPATMNTALAGKQDVISDLSDIRSGASAGATAVQPADMNTALAGKQDVISDLSTIRSGAAAGATAVQPATMNSALALKEDAANKSQTLDPTSATEFPSSAATASFVNSSVATNTATFRGNFKLADLGLTYPATNAQIEAALDAHTWPVGVVPTNNDYVYVEIENPQTTGIDDVVERFKYDGSYWHYEYTLNNSSFTAAEKAAIDSGIDSAKVAIYDAHVANGDIHVTAAEKATWNAKQDAISDLSTIRSGAAAGATAVQPGDLATVASTGAYSDLSGTPTIPVVDQTYDASSANAQSGVAVASAISGKQDTISDLATIRSGAAAGATAVQPGDLSAVATTGAYSDLSGTPTVDQTYSAASTNAQSGVAVASAIAGVNAVPASTSSDADKVLTVDAQGVPGWANAQAPISAGSGIDITNNVVSAKVDGTSVSFNAQGQLQSAAGTQADWAENDPADPSYIVAKPVPKMLTAGNGISITENQSTITIANTSTVDQTYNASSANAQSGIAVASGISNAVSGAIGDLPTNLTAAQIEAIKVALGIDETELFSGNATGNTPINLSESMFHFERLKIWICSKEDANNPVSIVEVPTSGLSSYLWVYLTDRYNNTWQWITWRFSYAITNSGTTLTEVSNAYGGSNSNSTWSAGLNVYDNHVYKIVGIHRIASN